MADSNERLAREFPSLAKELLGTGPAAPAPQQQADARAAPPPSPPSTPTPSVNRLAKEFPSLAAELLGQEPPAQRQEALAEVKASGTGVAPLELEAPEGLDATSPVFGEFRKLAGELGLDKERAGKVLALYQRELQEQEKAWRSQVDGWRAELERDPEIMDGADEMRTFVAEHGGREFVDALGDLGNLPAIIRGLVRMAAAARRGRR